VSADEKEGSASLGASVLGREGGAENWDEGEGGEGGLHPDCWRSVIFRCWTYTNPQMGLVFGFHYWSHV
jgi:hypothetical protein